MYKRQALFPPSDVDALVDILADVDDHPHRWDGYGDQARRTYQSRFTPEANIARLLAIYRFALAHPIESSRGPGEIAGRFRHSPSGVPT